MQEESFVCAKCGREISEDSDTCKFCGAPAPWNMSEEEFKHSSGDEGYSYTANTSDTSEISDPCVELSDGIICGKFMKAASTIRVIMIIVGTISIIAAVVILIYGAMLESLLIGLFGAVEMILLSVFAFSMGTLIYYGAIGLSRMIENTKQQ